MASSVLKRTLGKKDTALMRELARRVPRVASVGGVRNRELKPLLKRVNTLQGMVELERLAKQRGLFDLRIERRRWRDTDGSVHRFTCVRAATTDMWPMGTHFWLRDNAIIGARLIFSGERSKEKIGREMLLSGLSFISSVAQLSRFRAIINSSSHRFRRDPANWPYIFAQLNGNLSTERPELWAHKQDAWQILAWYVIEALEKGLLPLSELTDKHRKFLGYIVPFLAKVSFVSCENSGSWEEIAAVRTSVRAWEHRLIVKLGELATQKEFSFLAKQYRAVREALGKRYSHLSFAATVAMLDRAAIRVMRRALPFEAASYAEEDPRYRTADAALIYLLQIEYLDFLTERGRFGDAWRLANEEALISELRTLDDKVTGGVARYGNDSYQRSGFFRPTTVQGLADLYGAPSGDASAHFVGRDEIVPRGRKAMWTHFVWQLAAWAGQRSLEDPDPRYRALHDEYFMRGLALITGEKEVSLEVSSDGDTRLIRIPRWRMPECYISERVSTRQEVVVPSPHTPLNWSIAEMMEAFRIRKMVVGV
jgi:hypothetical protein